MRKMRLSPVAWMLGGIVLLSGLVTTPAYGCFQMCTIYCEGRVCVIECNSELKPESIHTEIRALPGNGAMITIYGGTSAAMENEFSCATAIPWVPEIAGARRGANLRESEGNHLIYNLEPNSTPIHDFKRLAREHVGNMVVPERWLGFHVTVSGRRIDPSVAKMVYYVDLKPGKTVYDLADSLRRQGLMMSGSANADGTLDLHHWDYLRLGDHPIVVTGDGLDLRSIRPVAEN
jgi:hypothetical protein